MSYESTTRQLVIETAHKLAKQIKFAITTHATHARKLRNATRLWDKQTPYGVHPAWCAMTILQETDLPEETRRNGYQALLLHDILEDTTASLPDDTSSEVRALVEGMTFEGIDREREQVWSRGKEIILLKLYDKTSNLLEGKTMYPDRKVLYVAYIRRLIEEVRKSYGELNIVTIAEALCSKHEVKPVEQPKSNPEKKLEAAKRWISTINKVFGAVYAKFDDLGSGVGSNLEMAERLSSEIDHARQELTKLHRDELGIDQATYDEAIKAVIP